MSDIMFTDGHRIRAILRVALAVDTKICGVTLIQILLLVFKAISCAIFSSNNFSIEYKQSKLGQNDF